MNRFFTLLLAASCLTAVGQEDCVDVSSTFDFSALYLEADYYAADSILYYYVRFYPNGMGEYWQLDPASTLGVLSFEYSLCEQNGNIFYTDSFLYEAQVNANGVFEGTTNTGEPFTFTPVREGSPFETETNNCGWQPDGNGDNLIGVNDLLDLLGVYGDTDYDQDDIWDSVDDCVGEYDECGVCNGSGPSIPIIENIEILYDSLYAEPIDEWWIFEVGADTTYQYVCGLGCTDPLAENYNELADTDDGSCSYQWACGEPLEYQGYDYETVQIGEQCWFAEDLRATKFSDGTDLSYVGDVSYAVNSFPLEPVYADVTTTPSSIDGQNGNFGNLYNWPVLIDGRGVCPSGWSPGSEQAWAELFQFAAENSPLPEGVSLKSGSDWVGGNGENVFGFNAKPNGHYTQGACFYGQWANEIGIWWTSSPTDEGTGFLNYLYSNNDDFDGYGSCSPGICVSVRCIKDTE